MVTEKNKGGDMLDEITLEQLENLKKILETPFTEEISPDEKDFINLLNAMNAATVLPVRVKKLHENAVLPTYAKDGDAGMDLTITSREDVVSKDRLAKVIYGFGIAMEIPKNHVGLIFPRSSVHNKSMYLTNCVGVIDSGYRGEIKAIFKLEKESNYEIYKLGDRACQIIIIPYPSIKMVWADELSDTERNDGGFGHTGK